MKKRKYGNRKEHKISFHHQTYRFHHQRVPLVILVCGTACVGKSTVATQLAQRLNLPNVLQVRNLRTIFKSILNMRRILNTYILSLT
jgi:2-phosphoglycerate kinase